MTRFMFAFELIALFFAACSFIVGILALCTRIASYLGGFFALAALFFQTLAVSLMTWVLCSGTRLIRLTIVQSCIRDRPRQLPLKRTDCPNRRIRVRLRMGRLGLPTHLDRHALLWWQKTQGGSYDLQRKQEDLLRRETEQEHAEPVEWALRQQQGV